MQAGAAAAGCLSIAFRFAAATVVVVMVTGCVKSIGSHFAADVGTAGFVSIEYRVATVSAVVVALGCVFLSSFCRF